MGSTGLKLASDNIIIVFLTINDTNVIICFYKYKYFHEGQRIARSLTHWCIQNGVKMVLVVHHSK
jgi:hypothetical protein